MKKNALTTAVVAGLIGVAGFVGLANAAHLNPDVLGQVLLYPYYTVQDNQQTLLSVVNPTNSAKTVKVRFLEGYNTREVVDFTVFLSPFDVWTASIFALDQGRAEPHTAIIAADDVHYGDAREVGSQHDDWVVTFPTRHFVVDPPPLLTSAGLQVDDASGFAFVHLQGFYLEVTEPATVGVAPG